MKGLVRRVASGERGFTLIELLVVVAILGIIAAVVVLNIGSFIGAGAVEAANTEAHQVSTAAIAYMTAFNQASLSDTSVAPGQTTGVESYLLNPNSLQATYTLSTAGKITAAVETPGGKWDALHWDAGAGMWVKD